MIEEEHEQKQQQKRISMREIVEKRLDPSIRSGLLDRLEEIQKKEGKRFTPKQYNGILKDAYTRVAFNHALRLIGRGYQIDFEDEQ